MKPNRGLRACAHRATVQCRCAGCVLAIRPKAPRAAAPAPRGPGSIEPGDRVRLVWPGHAVHGLKGVVYITEPGWIGVKWWWGDRRESVFCPVRRRNVRVTRRGWSPAAMEAR